MEYKPSEGLEDVLLAEDLFVPICSELATLTEQQAKLVEEAASNEPLPQTATTHISSH